MLVFDEAIYIYMYLWKGAARDGCMTDNLNMFHIPTQMMLMLIVPMLIFRPWENVEGNSHTYQSVSNV